MKKIQTNKKPIKEVIKEFKADQPRFDNAINTLVKKGKGKAIKEEIHHKVKAGDRRRQVNKQIDDNLLIRTLEKELYMACSNHWQGEYSKEKARNKKYKRMFWTAVGIIIAIPIIYVGIIAIIDTIN